MFLKHIKTLLIFLISISLFACIKDIGLPMPDGNSSTVSQYTGRGVNRISPVLRLNTQMHTSIIKRIDVDAAGRYLVTGSDDKTVRVWSLPDGKLLRVLRPHIAKGHEGKIYSVAISPDGKTVAVGGWTSESGLNNAIYLFNRATGELRQRITGGQLNRILHLAYSLNGQTLAATLKQGGIRFYRTSDYSLQAQDTDYGSDSYWAAFDRQGRVVTTCKDGYIRLYDQQFKLLNKRKPAGGNYPYAVSFSPTGDKIAVGFQDSTQIKVLSGNDLNLLYNPNTQALNNGSLDNVAWSADGKWLYAGGRYSKNGRKVALLRWHQDLRYTVASAASNSIMDIRPLPGGKVVIATAEPSISIFNTKGQKLLERQAGIADFRGTKLLVSNDASIVQFGYQYGNRQTGRFSLHERLLTVNPTNSSGLTAPKAASKPTLNLKPHEIVRSFASSPDGQQILVGTQWFLRYVDQQGHQQWQTEAPSIAWAVNIAENGKVALAGFGDGTLRWYRLSDGKELLAFFPHRDGKRWIIWTPQGYYAASSGGESLIGWHLDNGANQAADFFPAARFRNNYYRPDVVAKVLNTLDISESLRLAEENLKKQVPPVITLLSPEDGSDFSDNSLTLRYSIRRPSNEPVTAIKVLIDGRPLENTKGLQRIPQETKSMLRITVPKRDVEVSLIAENKYAASEPATVRLRWQGARTTVKKPTLYVLAIGVGKFDNPSISTLKYAPQDARDLVELLKGQQNQGLYDKIQIKLLEEPRKAEILEGLKWINKETTQEDIAIVAISGHGYNDEKGDYYFIPRDIDPNNIQGTALPYKNLKETMSTLLGKALFFIDTCHAGNVMGKHRGVADVNKVANDLSSSENGVIVFTASTGTQKSLEDSKWKNGAFTEALLEGLKGRADYTKDTKISTKELDLYLSERVMELTNGRQTPTTAIPQTIISFPIVLAR
jgi:WD40 repeat protein